MIILGSQHETEVAIVFSCLLLWRISEWNNLILSISSLTDWMVVVSYCWISCEWHVDPTLTPHTSEKR